MAVKRKVLLLGGSCFQIPSVKKAREMGLHVVTCDYLPANPGHKYAHEYFNVSTTDRKAVLELAKSLRIDAVVCYASDPAAPTAAYVAEKLKLPGQPLESVELLTDKERFRSFLAKNGFKTPRAMGFASLPEAASALASFKMPVMVKPIDSSGSKGVSMISEAVELEPAFSAALSFSRAKRVLVEEFVERAGHQVAGDGFSVDGKLVFRCFANEHFNSEGNRLVPIGESWPFEKPETVQAGIHEEIQRALSLLEMRSGAYNFDIRLASDGAPTLMEIGPRNGGNLIPQVVQYATGVDMAEFTIKAALGDDCGSLRQKEVEGFWSSYMIHSAKPGIFSGLWLEPGFKAKNLVELDVFPKAGDAVGSFNGSNGTLGTMILKFESMDEMMGKMDGMGEYARVLLD